MLKAGCDTEKGKGFNGRLWGWLHGGDSDIQAVSKDRNGFMISSCGMERGSTRQVEGTAGAEAGRGQKCRLHVDQKKWLVSHAAWVCGKEREGARITSWSQIVKEFLECHAKVLTLF